MVFLLYKNKFYNKIKKKGKGGLKGNLVLFFYSN